MKQKLIHGAEIIASDSKHMLPYPLVVSDKVIHISKSGHHLRVHLLQKALR